MNGSRRLAGKRLRGARRLLAAPRPRVALRSRVRPPLRASARSISDPRRSQSNILRDGPRRRPGSAPIAVQALGYTRRLCRRENPAPGQVYTIVKGVGREARLQTVLAIKLVSGLAGVVRASLTPLIENARLQQHA